MQRDQLRASDDDRERIAAILREAHAEGRLDRDEFDERLEATYGAKTFGTLKTLITDLPDTYGQLAKPASSAVAPRPAGPIRQKARRAARKTLNILWWLYAVAVAINVVVWGSLAIFLQGDAPPFWPIFVAGPLGVVLGVSEVAYRSGDQQRGT